MARSTRVAEGARGSTPRVRRSGLVLALVLATTLAGLAPRASAVIVHGAHGHFFGVTLHRGVSPTRIPGSVPAQRAARGLSSPGGNLDYQGGPVMHSSTSYLIYWTPSGESIPTSWQGLLGRYFTDAAADSGKASNVYAVARQYTDGSGFADYRQTFSPSSQAIVDTQAYPTTDSANCPSSFPHCITDIQLQQELSRLIAADSLPNDGPSSATELPGSAPIYFVVLPTNVDECFPDNPNAPQCAAGDFCAYHSAFTDGSNNVLYAAIPTLVVGGGQQDPKACQSDNNPLVQEPNGSPADVVLKYVSHEHNETITDPLATGWISSTSGNENGDNCNQSGSFNPANGTNPNAFTPTLGGSAGAGTLYNQAINGNHYYLQSEWSNGDPGSNGDGDCRMNPSGGTVTSQFSVPAGPNLPHTALSFNPSGSSSSNGYTSVTWNFGDSSAPLFNASGSGPSTVSHTYAAVGRYAVTLTLVDNRGNLATATQQVPVGRPPSAAFTSSPSQPFQGGAISFDGTTSSDPDSGVTITSYSWDFGDGTPAGTGAKPSHTYTTPGTHTYTVKLTVTNSIGLTNTSTQSIIVDELPTAAFTVGPAQPIVGQVVSFNGSSSSDPDGTIASYAWNFGDNSTGTGATPTHTYTSPGIYTVQLIVTDSDGRTSNAVTQQLTVGSPPTASFTFMPAQPFQGGTISFDGTGSSDPNSGGTITSYSWDFGDGTPAVTGAKPSHAYATPGTHTYMVKLTVTDNLGLTNTSTQPITVDELPTAAFTIGAPQPPVGPVSFDGTTSNDPDGTITSYAWNFGDNSTGTGATPTHQYTSAGIYTVQLSVTDSDGGTSSPVSQQVTVGSPPTAAFTFSPSQPVQGSAVSFDGAGSTDPDPGVTIASYTWDFGDGTTGAGATTTHTYTSPGTYTAKLTVTNSIRLTNTSTQSITVDELPTAAFSIGTPEPMVGQPVSFNGSSNDPDGTFGTFATYTWNFGDGTTTTGANATPTHAYATAGPYTVQLTVTDSDGRTSNPVTQQLVVHPPPTASFTISPSQPLERAPVSFNFTGSTEPGTTISSYAWSFGDRTPPASGATPIHSYASPGTYVVRLTVTNSLGLTATTSQPVTVADEDPHAAFVVKPAHPASGQPVSFDGSSSSDPDGSISSYRWDFGDGTRAGSGSKPTHVYRKPGSYTVRLTITDSAGLSVTARGRASVALAGRITKISFGNGAGGPKLLVAVNAPGVLSAGGKTARVKKAGTAKFAIRLTAAQQSTLSSTDQLKLPIQIRFAPLAGLRSTRTLILAFRSAGPGTARISAVLKR